VAGFSVFPCSYLFCWQSNQSHPAKAPFPLGFLAAEDKMGITI
jgi:hypothetical protein